MKHTFSFIIKLQFLGFRFSGWQKQTNSKTLHQMVDKTLAYVLKKKDFKTIGIGRTDAKVSANCYYIQLFVNDAIDEVSFLESLNSNFSSDFKALSVKQVAISYSIIKAVKIKEYHYYFSYGDKNHPFATPFLVNFDGDLDLEIMKSAAQLFKGEHYFNKYCTKPSANTIFKRTIDVCEIVENIIITANFFPEKSYILKVKGAGFLRYQIRLMMAMLIEVGKGAISLQYIIDSLKENNDQQPLRNIAPSSGLQLYNIELKIK